MKRFILDTNVILDDANFLNQFTEAIIIIPITVIEELDNFKRDMNNLGRNARHFSNLLDDYRDNKGTISGGNGIEIRKDVFLKIVLENEIDIRMFPNLLDWSKNDNKILLVALNEKRQHPKDEIIFISKDTNLRIKADSLGVISENFSQHSNLNINEVYTGYREISVTRDFIDDLYDNRVISYEPEDDVKFFGNEYVIFSNEDKNRHIARYDLEDGLFHLIDYNKISEVFGISPRNDEQRIALDMLINPNIKLVSLIGKAGTGKTLLAIAAGLELTTNNTLYDKMLVSRPVFPMGKDIGFLPGDIGEKLKPWMQPIFDNLELLLLGSSKEKKSNELKKKKMEEFMDMGIIEVEPLTYIRGRSIPNQYMIIDEAQNLTNLEIKTIITRAGEGTKIVLTGDPYQIDQPYLDSINNGLVHVIEKMKGVNISSSVTLKQGERSGLAQLAADLL
jgi:PhoH-like ATPase